MNFDATAAANAGIELSLYDFTKVNDPLSSGWSDSMVCDFAMVFFLLFANLLDCWFTKCCLVISPSTSLGPIIFENDLFSYSQPVVLY